MSVIFITGGGGKSGKALIEHFAHNDTQQEIVVLDNFVSSDITEFLTLQTRLNTNKVTLFDFDITHPNMVPFIKERYQRIDCIYHLAKGKNNSLAALETGYTGTKQILELARYYNSTLYYKKTTNQDVVSLVSEALCRSYKEHFNLNINYLLN